MSKSDVVEFEGTVVSIPVNNGDIVEYGETLVIIR